MDRIIDFLDENSPFYFATTDGQQAYVRPFGLVFEHEGKIYFSMGTHKASYKQLQSDPCFEVCTANKYGKWIRIRGTGVLDDAPGLFEIAARKSPMLRELYNSKTGNTLGFIYLKDGVAEFCDMQGGFESVAIHV